MSRVLLVSSNVTTEPYPVYPLGMAVIASALKGAGHEIRQFDYLASGESLERLQTAVDGFLPDFVCVSIRNLDNCDSLSSTGYPATARKLIGLLRGITSAPVIIGGPAFSILPDELLAYTGADYGVVGEGELVICELLAKLEAKESVPRIMQGSCLLKGSDMAPPLYDDEMVRFYMTESSMINLQTKRGCPHKCIYCSYPMLEGKNFRYRDPRAVVDDIVRIGIEHGANSFFFTDSVFNDSEENYLDVVDEILRRNVGIRWCCYLRPQGVGRKEIALMKRAGMYAAELGTDAASNRTLHGLGKGFTFEEALEVNRAFVAEQIPCAHFVMFGGPGETMESVDEGLANLDKLEHTVVFAFSGIRILPGTPLMELAVREGIVQEGQWMREPVYYLSPRLDGRLMNEKIAAAFQNRRDRAFPPAEVQKRLSIMHRFGYRGLLWDTLINFPKNDKDKHAEQ